MKIFLKGKFTGRLILNTFESCLTALMNGSLNRKYELVPIQGDFLGMSLDPHEAVYERGAEFVPYTLTHRRKYFLFGSMVDKWKPSKELRIHLEPLDLRKEYEVVNIHFEGIGWIPGEDGPEEREVILLPTDDDYEVYRKAIEKFLDIFEKNLKV